MSAQCPQPVSPAREVEELDIELHMPKERKRLGSTGLHEDIERALATLEYSTEDIDQAEFFRAALERADSAIVISPYCACSRSLATLILCLNTALRAKSSHAASDATHKEVPPMNPDEREIFGPLIPPSVLVIVSSDLKGPLAFQAFEYLIRECSLPITVGDCSFVRPFATETQPDAADIAICSPVEVESHSV